MNRIVMLGTGNGSTLDLYNTCFVIQNEDGVFLVDTGGSIEILRRLKKANIPLESIRNIFISHSHTDHIFGLIWMFKILGTLDLAEFNNEKINIYCNDVVYETIRKIADCTLSKSLMKKVYDILNFVILSDNEKILINGNNYEFFDIKAKGTKQFGFESEIDGNRFIFLGDEPLNSELSNRVENADYVTHEAFCLDKEADQFHPYEKNHSTALSTAKTMNQLRVKNLILYHTEETHGEVRQKLYKEEAQSIFNGNVIVPNDLDIIKLIKK